MKQSVIHVIPLLPLRQKHLIIAIFTWIELVYYQHPQFVFKSVIQLPEFMITHRNKVIFTAWLRTFSAYM